MRARGLIVAVLVLLLSPGFIGPSSADTSFTIDTTLPFDEIVTNTCSGETIEFIGQDHIVIAVDVSTDSYHFKFHANGQLTGDVLAPILQLGVYSANQTEDQEQTVSMGNDIYNLVTTFVAVNHVNPKVNMKLMTELQINFNAKTLVKSHTNAQCEVLP